MKPTGGPILIPDLSLDQIEKQNVIDKVDYFRRELAHLLGNRMTEVSVEYVSGEKNVLHRVTWAK